MSTNKNFVERPFTEVPGGEYDEFGFYHTPNGSKQISFYLGFWDADGFYFNRDGKDKHGGSYNDEWVYVPGQGWDEANQCYEDDLDDLYEEGEDFEDIDEDDIFDKINYEKNKEKLKFEDDVNSVPTKKEEVKEEKKQSTENSQNNTQTNKPTGGLKGLLSGSSNTSNDTRPKGRPQTAVTRGGKK